MLHIRIFTKTMSSLPVQTAIVSASLLLIHHYILRYRVSKQTDTRSNIISSIFISRVNNNNYILNNNTNKVKSNYTAYHYHPCKSLSSSYSSISSSSVFSSISATLKSTTFYRWAGGSYGCCQARRDNQPRATPHQVYITFNILFFPLSPRSSKSCLAGCWWTSHPLHYVTNNVPPETWPQTTNVPTPESIQDYPHHIHVQM